MGDNSIEGSCHRIIIYFNLVSDVHRQLYIYALLFASFYSLSPFLFSLHLFWSPPLSIPSISFIFFALPRSNVFKLCFNHKPFLFITHFIRFISTDRKRRFNVRWDERNSKQWESVRVWVCVCRTVGDSGGGRKKMKSRMAPLLMLLCYVLYWKPLKNGTNDMLYPCLCMCVWFPQREF